MIYGIIAARNRRLPPQTNNLNLNILSGQSIALTRQHFIAGTKDITLGTPSNVSLAKRRPKLISISSPQTIIKVAPSWTVAFTATGGSASNGWSGFNLRNVVPLSASGSKFRLTLVAATVGASIDGLYAGHSAGGISLNFDGTQVPVTKSGTQNISIGASATMVTDEITYAVNSANPFLIAIHFGGTSNVQGYGGGTNAGFKSAANETSSTTVTGYAGGAGNPWLVQKIEVFN